MASEEVRLAALCTCTDASGIKTWNGLVGLAISKASDGKKGDVLARVKVRRDCDYMSGTAASHRGSEHLRNYEAHCALIGHISPGKTA
jgi:hypothetical protein